VSARSRLDLEAEVTAMRHINLERRGRYFYYRASFTLDGKVVVVRLALNTISSVIAHERAARMDRVLKGRWKQLVSNPTNKIDELDRASILRHTALQVRGELETLYANEQAIGNDDAEEASLDHLRTLRGLEYVVRDIFTHGVGPAFGTHDYFMDRFVEGLPQLDGAQLERIREILSTGSLIAQASDEGAVKALLRRNVPTTPANIVMARRQIMLGVLIALREAEQQVREPGDQLDQLLASFTMPDADVAFAAHDVRHAVAAQITTGRDNEESPPAAATTNSLLDQATASVPDVSLPVPSTTSELTLADASKAFLAANPKFDTGFASSRWTPKTRSQFEAAIFLAGKFFGVDTPIGTIGEAGVADLFRTLRRLPSNHHKTPVHGGMSLQAIAALNKGEGLSLATTNRHMRFLRTVFEWAGKRMPNPPVIAWSAFVEADSRVKRDKRLAFNAGELETMFAGPIWHGSESRVRRVKPGRHVWQDAAYWVPILLVYTGARREEVCKALVDDFECVDGIWVLHIRATATGRVKTASSTRDVPLADEVLRLGFLDFLKYHRTAGNATIFPELAVGASNYGDAFYKRCWRAMMRAGLVAADKNIHSIRHFVATTLAEHDVSEERRADLLGHTILTSETARTYTKRSPLWILRDVVNTIPKVTVRIECVRIQT
jgi:integrase